MLKSARPAALAVGLALALLGVGSAGAHAQDPDPPGPPPQCGPGQKPSTDLCTPRPCASGEDPAQWECIASAWPDPVGSTMDCYEYYAYYPGAYCPNVATHGPIAGVWVNSAPPPRQEAPNDIKESACSKHTGDPYCRVYEPGP